MLVARESRQLKHAASCRRKGVSAHRASTQMTIDGWMEIIANL
jgi:hypothetical protein